MDTYSKIRKLRKKLRQIENLESIDRDLTDEEVSKCMKKESIREELLELLVAYNSQSAQDESESNLDSSIATNTTGADVSFSTPISETNNNAAENVISDDQTETFTRDTGNTNEIEKEETQWEIVPEKRSPSAAKHNPVSQQRQEKSEKEGQRSETSTSKSSGSESRQPPSPAKKSKTKKSGNDASVRAEWSGKLFEVSFLESHSDLVTAVDCSDGLLVSASRDTTVKVWDLNTLTELRSLGSHTGSVTDVVVLPGKVAAKLDASFPVSEGNHVILSGSTDCTLNIWSANTGELLKSIYTYNPITKVAFYPDTCLVATGSDGGKLELWNIATKENVCSGMVHSDAITGLCISDSKIYTSCAVDGEIKVFEVRNNTLHCIYASEKSINISGDAVTLRHVRSLGVRGDNIYYGDDGVNLKYLAWRKGLVRKLPNHKEEFGMTDAICSHGNLMMTSAYDLDNGHGYMNVFDISAEPNYLATLDCEETRRILDICCCSNSNGNITIVTAGLDLQVWKQVSSNRNDTETVKTTFIPSLSQPAQDSDIESDVEFTDTESEDSSRRGSRRGSAASQGSSWMSWCTLT